MCEKEVDLKASIEFSIQVGLVHLNKTVDAIAAGKKEITDTHFKRAGDALLDALITKYTDVAYQSGDLFVILEERRKRKPPEFTVAENTEILQD